MKTTMEIPDALFRRAKAVAAQQGISMREFVSDAIGDKLSRTAAPAKPWMDSFGKLRGLRKETARINRVIEQESETIEPEYRP